VHEKRSPVVKIFRGLMVVVIVLDQLMVILIINYLRM